MNILFNGKIVLNQSPITMCVGYRAKAIVMQKGDFASLLALASRDTAHFNALMVQLESRFR